MKHEKLINAHHKKLGNTQWRLLPWKELEEVVNVFMYGNTKYEEDDWKNVPNKKSIYFDAMMRHIVAWKTTTARDESDFSHLAHAMACILILLWSENNEKNSN
jgi:hypothetical protein